MVQEEIMKKTKSQAWWLMLVALIIFGFILAYFIPPVIRNPSASNLMVITVMALIELFIFYRVIKE
jgi:hypothetical protein